MNNEKIIENIKKCLALSKSNNEHEAALALEHAQRLMRINGIDDVDIELRKITSFDVPSILKFSKWQLLLLTLISETFGCGCYQQIDVLGHSKIRCYGFNCKAEVAGYAYEVLLRQIKHARLEFMRMHLSRVRITKNKTFRADKFCEGWVTGAYHAVSKMKISEQEKNALDKYLHKSVNKPKTIRPISSSNSVATRATDDDLRHGFNAGKNAKIHNAVNNTNKTTPILGR